MAYQIKEFRNCPHCGRRIPIATTSGKLRKHPNDGKAWNGQEACPGSGTKAQR